LKKTKLILVYNYRIIKTEKLILKLKNRIMERKDILSQIKDIFIDTLDNEKIVIEETTQATDVDEWDSLTHIILVVAIEKNFKINFNSTEILSWKNIGEMVNCIEGKI